MSLFLQKHRAKVHKRAIEKWGCSTQAVVAIEEMSELQKEICKHFRGADNLDAMAEEIADVIIVLEQLQIMLGLNEKVEKMLDAKIFRLLGRTHEMNLTTEECEKVVSRLTKK